MSKPTFEEEKRLWNKGYTVLGIDEVGRGAFAGPIVAAASIIAKVYRDNLMNSLHKKYPFYGFDKNKGYGTKKHRDAIKKFGLSTIHRLSFNLRKHL